MRTDDFDYNLPEERIAQAPAEPRDSCKMLVLHRETGAVEHKIFRDICDFLEPGDLLVANQTRVLPARLIGRKAVTRGVSETLLLKCRLDVDQSGNTWECLVNPGKRLKPGAVIEYRAGGVDADESEEVILTGTITGFVDESKGGRLVCFEPKSGRSLNQAIHEIGRVPLPPYITDYHGDSEKYQTVYSFGAEHSAAAPTAGLHFTPELIEKLKNQGVGFKTVELEVGIDTFRTVDEDDPRDHVMHTERYHVSQEVIDAIHATKASGHRVIAVGTTSVRSLESAWEKDAEAWKLPCVARHFENRSDSADTLRKGDVVVRKDATTQLFLMPGSTFHVVDGLITNFHVPRSTLMMLVSAFASREQIMDAYQQAIDHKYRMLSFGDAMFIE